MQSIRTNNGFTLVEMMVVVLIIALLFTALYMGSQPYMMRSRDTKRVTDMTSYLNIIDAYERNFETFPSNTGSGGALLDGYCLTELGTRMSNYAGKDQKFAALNVGSSAPPRDPLPINLHIWPCGMDGSYLYSRIKYGTYNENEVAVIAARFEIRASGNYGTWGALTWATDVPAIVAAKKSTIPNSTPDALFIVSSLR